MTMLPQFAVIIVNYNCASYALTAAQSALGDGAGLVIIVDNASTDGSLDQLRGAHGATGADAAPGLVNLKELTPQFADEGACASTGLIVVQAKANNGFAAGCNIGLRAALKAGYERFLLLNPDAALARGALAAFERRLRDNRIGLCGASVLGWSAPHLVQAAGGARLDPVLLTGRNIGEGKMLDDLPARSAVEARLDYPLGAAIAFRRDFPETAGLLDERYFLYFEEADWARAGAAHFATGWAPDAIVFHRYGGSTGSARASADAGKMRTVRSPLAEYHMARSRLLFAAKWRPAIKPLAYVHCRAQAVARSLRGEREQADALLEGARREAPRHIA